MKTILISAGHSTVPPKDPGAVGNGLVEAQIALQMRDAVANSLRKFGCQVVEDGADGINEPLTKAIALAHSAAYAIEFHLNAGPAAATGIEVLSKPDKKALAQKIAAVIHNATQLPLRGGEGGYKSDSSGQHHRLGFCNAGGLIVELCFISNKGDTTALMEHFSEVAAGIAGVLAGAVGMDANLADTAEMYTVVSGDTLTKIAGRFGLSLADLKRINGLTSDAIDIGQPLKVK